MFVMYNVSESAVKFCDYCDKPMRGKCYYHEWCKASYCTKVGQTFCLDCYVIIKERSLLPDGHKKLHCYDGYTDEIKKGRSTFDNDSFWRELKTSKSSKYRTIKVELRIGPMRIKSQSLQD